MNKEQPAPQQAEQRPKPETVPTGPSNNTVSPSETQDTQPIAPPEAAGGMTASTPSRANAEAAVQAQFIATNTNAAPAVDPKAELAKARQAAEAYQQVAQTEAQFERLSATVQSPVLGVEISSVADGDPNAAKELDRAVMAKAA